MLRVPCVRIAPLSWRLIERALRELIRAVEKEPKLCFQARQGLQSHPISDMK